MQLTVVIVNYNVKYFLEQCLFSVRKAGKNIAMEVIVVDNNSTDGSVEYLSSLFPEVILIENKDNTGFGKACNQGVDAGSGKYVLFLNPDTIVAEDCFEKCIQFMDTTPDSGAVGVKMIDGKGVFLKESKRAFPSPLTSLFKLAGLAKLFPKSKLFARYHLGHLDQWHTHEVDVLSGAFMLLRREVIEKMGIAFDETFFMYGEDIDLSYRIQQQGYKNYYFSETEIIHFKGESTKKGSLNYVRLFYKAMSQFVEKHYTGGKARIFNTFIHIAIWLRAAITAIGKFSAKIAIPLLHFVLILFSFDIMETVWMSYTGGEVKYIGDSKWPTHLFIALALHIPVYLAGFYDKSYKETRIYKTISGVIAVLLIIDSLLMVEKRFPASLLLSGVIVSAALIVGTIWLLRVFGVLANKNSASKLGSTLVVGSTEEYKKIMEIYTKAQLQGRILGRIALSENDDNKIGNLSSLPQLVKKIPIQEIIFCEGNLSYQSIFKHIKQIHYSISIKFYATGSQSVVGSDSQDNSGESISFDANFQIAQQYHIRFKRILDIFVALIGIVLFPIWVFMVQKPLSFFTNCVAVLFGKKTWVGYALSTNALPSLRNNIFAPNGALKSAIENLPKENLESLDYWYAKEYNTQKDVIIVWKMFRKLGG